VTGEGSLLDNAADTNFKAVRRTPSPDNSRGITIAAAKFSSEDAATLVQYTIAIIEYTRLCGPLKSALDKQSSLEREIEENERVAREKANQVQPSCPHLVDTLDSPPPSDHIINPLTLVTGLIGGQLIIGLPKSFVTIFE